MNERRNNRAALERRHAIAALVSTPLAAPLAVARAQPASGTTAPTPAQTLGPFYPRSASERPAETDADLVVVTDGHVVTRGVPIYFTGRVVARDGKPLAQALVEIWQCDANAVYHHPDGGAENQRDPNFQGYGQTRTDAAGVFHFRTIKPVPYPGRTAHIHVRVQSERGSLATQLYLPGDAGNDRDMIYRHLNAAERARVALNLVPTRAEHPLARATEAMAQVELVLA